jgi:DHA1 family tetracycline resistance protein-like MFS transporter
VTDFADPADGLTPARRRQAVLAVTIANFAALAGFGVFFPILPQYGLGIGASATEIGVAIAAFSLGQLVAGPFVGRLSDRFGRRRVLLWSLAISAITHALNAFCVTPLALILVRLIGGLAAASFGVSFAVASDVSTPEQRTRVMAIVGSGLSLGFILGPALGGLIAGATAEAADFVWISFAAAGLAAAAFVATAFLLPETSAPKIAPRDGDALPKNLLRSTPIVRLLWLTLFSAAAVAMMEANFTLFAASVLAAGPRTIGLVFGAMGVLTTLLQFVVAGYASQRLGEERVMEIGLALQAAGLGLLALASTMTVAVCGALIIAAGFALLTPALASLTSLTSPATMQGEVLGLQQGSGALGRVFGPGASGALYDGYGANAPFLIGAIGMAIALLYARFSDRGTAPDS